MTATRSPLVTHSPSKKARRSGCPLRMMARIMVVVVVVVKQEVREEADSNKARITIAFRGNEISSTTKSKLLGILQTITIAIAMQIIIIIMEIVAGEASTEEESLTETQIIIITITISKEAEEIMIIGMEEGITKETIIIITIIIVRITPIRNLQEAVNQESSSLKLRMSQEAPSPIMELLSITKCYSRNAWTQSLFIIRNGLTCNS